MNPETWIGIASPIPPIAAVPAACLATHSVADADVRVDEGMHPRCLGSYWNVI
jgi:hypothetical protein